MRFEQRGHPAGGDAPASVSHVVGEVTDVQDHRHRVAIGDASRVWAHNLGDLCVPRNSKSGHQLTQNT